MKVDARFHLRDQEILVASVLFIRGQPRLVGLVLLLRRRLRDVNSQIITDVIGRLADLVQPRTVTLKGIIHVFDVDLKLVKLHVEVVVLLVVWLHI